MSTPHSSPEIERFRAGADDGDAEAMFMLGVAYAQGQGIEQNELVASRWFHHAARRGHTRAMTSLGFLYSTGRGVPMDLVAGYVFLTKAAGEGDGLAIDIINRLRPRLTQTQIREAERRVSTPRLG